MFTGMFMDYKERNLFFEQNPDLRKVGARIYVDRNNVGAAVVQDWEADTGWTTVGGPMDPLMPAPVTPGNLIFHLSDHNVRHLKGRVGSGLAGDKHYGLIHNVELPFELTDGWLDMELWFSTDYDWDHARSSGKIPGLSSRGDERMLWSENGTGNCGPIHSAGWSSRCTWKQGGLFQLYAYHQRRPGECGHKMPWTMGPVLRGRWHRYTQHLWLNTPGVADGGIEIFWNSEKVFSRNDIMWRGDTSKIVGLTERAARANIAAVKLHNYFGGGPPSAPRRDCECLIRYARVTNYAPDFTIPLEPQKLALV